MAGKTKQWAARLTGFSTPIFGVSWTPPTADRDVASELLIRLEDRRVLYNPSTAEIPHHCVQSIIEVRHLLSEALVKAGDGELAEHLRALGAASRRFLDRVGGPEDDRYEDMRSAGHYLSWEFLDALGQLRAIFGVHIALMAAEYDLEVRGDLNTILPAEPSERDFSDSDFRHGKLRRY